MNNLQNTINKYKSLISDTKETQISQVFKSDENNVLCEYLNYDTEYNKNAVKIMLFPKIFNFLIDTNIKNKGLFLGFANNVCVYICPLVLAAWLKHLNFNKCTELFYLIIENKVNFPICFYKLETSTEVDKPRQKKPRQKKIAKKIS